ncbi:cysteine desulfurase [Propionicimonas paludicola]|uniref:Cysteine desulfurase n=1 Tax=Propionicimonas paludicola TaxID=185243 RepID=A0A2A9CRN5_9ACTN|nr:cysteine desulfurase family protein [Propionicimonas paludicola]PFG16786.1 cysteine desulfurase [Propionicimonas paludicola]
MDERSYLDHAAGSPILPEVLDAMLPVLSLAGNPNSTHAAGRRARRLLEESREAIAERVGALPAELIFTAGGTESNNLAILGAVGDPARPRLAISTVEHASVAAVVERSAEVDRLPVDASGHLDVAAAEQLITSATALVSVIWVNNETGAIQPISAVAELAHRHGALFHADAVAALGHVEIGLAGSGADLISLSAHKVGGPVGIGALVVRRGVRLRPVGFGGGQEARLRSGTVPVALAVGFAAAVRLAVDHLEAEVERLRGLRDQLIAELARLPQVRINTVEPAGPAIVNATFSGTRADDLLLLLDGAGVEASTGSACSAGVHQPSEVLLAMGRSQDDASASLRFSFGPSTTSTDIERVVAVLPTALARARRALG